jgi:uncharacterized protein
VRAERECVERLATQVVGRVAVVIDGEARVFPVNYLFDHGAIVLRTDERTKLDAARAGALVTFPAVELTGTAGRIGRNNARAHRLGG